MKKVSEGYRSISYLDGNDKIVLKGKNYYANKSYIKDYKTLKTIGKYIKSVDIPNNVELIGINDEFLYGGLRYSFIGGLVFDYNLKDKYNLEGIANGLSAFLNELHSIKTKYNRNKIINDEILTVNQNIDVLKKYLDLNYMDKITKIWLSKYNRKLDDYEDFSIVHGDLWYENYIISYDHQKLIGIIDFENSMVFMREYDFVPLLYISNDFISNVIKKYTYNLDKELINLLFIRREICSFKYILENEPDDVDEQLEKIRNSIDKYL